KMTAINCSYLCIVNNTDDTTFDPSILKPPFNDYVLPVFRVVAVICIFGYFGNFLLIFSTWRKGSTLNSKSHQLIAHLAIADIITCTAHMQVRCVLSMFVYSSLSDISVSRNAMVQLATINLREVF